MSPMAPIAEHDGSPVVSARKHENHSFCSLPRRSLDYNGNPARPLIRKVQQGINIIHHLLEGALVGYLLEIY